MSYLITIHNAETGEILEREMTQEEIEGRLATEASSENLRKIEKAQASAKAKLLEQLGITEEEAKLLLS